LQNQSDGLTRYLVVSVILANCLILLVIFYETLYKTGDSWSETILGIGQGIGSSVAVSIAVVSTWEVVLLLSERYRQKRYNEGKSEGKSEGKNEALDRVKEILERTGIKLPPETRKELFGEGSEETPPQG
jgi:hypothetical protein